MSGKANARSAEHQRSFAVPVSAASELPYMLRLLEKICSVLRERSLQKQSARQHIQSCNRENGSFRTGDCQRESAYPQTFVREPSQSHTVAAYLHNPRECLIEKGLVESASGNSIIGIRVVAGREQLIWGFDERNLPWA
jgi:hypothetical protein